MKSLLICLVLGVIASSNQSYGCSLKLNYAEISGPIAEIEIKLQHAAFTGIANIPAGWNFIIDNDPSWRTRLTGHAIVGAAFLDSSAFDNLLQINPEPGHSCDELSQSKDDTSLTVRVYVHDRIVSKRLSGGSIRVQQ